ncbi:MAG: signal peptidase II [Candidatus Shapirobacteria bacterium]|nr:signal peptidase II [Candidatus Shapirobacteria bacterium]
MLHEFVANNVPVIIKNEGISFGFSRLSNFLFVGLLVGLAGFYILKNKRGIGLITIGGMINFVDRYRFGYVRDYWNVWGNIFNNLNDWLIVAGVLLFIVEVWKKE